MKRIDIDRISENQAGSIKHLVEESFFPVILVC
jgi:hypothetical protein